jgi:surface antigen
LAAPPTAGDSISTTPSTLVSDRLNVPAGMRSTKAYRYLKSKLRRQTTRRRAIRTGLLFSNIVILGIILTFVLQNPHTSSLPSSAALSDNPTPAVSNPLDQVSSTDIAQTVAQLNSLPETTAITNQAQSQAADVSIASSNGNVLTKPQVVATDLKSRADIQSYTTKAGDTVSALASKFGVTSDSIRWSNGLTGDVVAPGVTLAIPPVNGVVYTVKAGDTADSLAAKFNANKDQIIAYNDGEISGIQVGEQIIIPNATESVAGTSAATIAAGAGGFPWGGGPIYGSNGYDFGYCTWYVASQISVPANWGNASTWAIYASKSGWGVSNTPTVGSIAQKGGGEGHVAIVTAVNPDGSVQVRDMNGFAGWGRVGTGTVSAGFFQNFISR